MAEFERKKRYIKYNQDECKFFLRKDFQKQCAYCLIKEADIGNPDNFEKDHFVPQKSGIIGRVHEKYFGENFDVNNYYNLYYCCQRCNGRSGKSNKWSSTLLDPCTDDIWGKHIKRLGNEVLEALTIEGDEYIRTFKLNSLRAIKIRQGIESQRQSIKRHLEALEGFIQSHTDDDKLTHWLRSEREKDLQKLEYGTNYDPGIYYLEEDSMLEAEAILSKYSIVKGDGDYELDYVIRLEGKTYYVKLILQQELSFINGEKGFYLPLIQVQDWGERNVLICCYDIKNKKLYYLDFQSYLSKNPIDAKKGRYFYKIQETSQLI